MIISYLFKCLSGVFIYPSCSSFHTCLNGQNFAQKYMRREASVRGPKLVYTGNLQARTVLNYAHTMNKPKKYCEFA